MQGDGEGAQEKTEGGEADDFFERDSSMLDLDEIVARPRAGTNYIVCVCVCVHVCL